MPAIAPRTERALEDLDAHSDADRAFCRTVMTVIADGIVDEHEVIELAARHADVEATRHVVQRQVETVHAGVTLVRSWLYTMELTPKLERKHRELMRGIEDLGEHPGAIRIRERDWMTT